MQLTKEEKMANKIQYFLSMKCKYKPPLIFFVLPITLPNLKNTDSAQCEDMPL